MQKGIPLRKISTKTAGNVGAFISLYQDLKYVMQITHKAVSLIESKLDDPLLLQTYWSAALIAYRRAFNTGVRGQKAPAAAFEKYEGAAETHAYFLNQADKLIAHSVNPFEEVLIGIFVNNDGSLAGVGELAGRLSATSKEGFRDLNQLAKIICLNLETQIKQAKITLEKESSRLTDAERLELPVARFTVPESQAASQSRKRLDK